MPVKEDKSQSHKVALYTPNTKYIPNKFMMQRSLLIFEHSIKSKFTLLQYKHKLETFLEFSKVKNYDSLAALDTDTIQSLLEDYILDMKVQGLKPITIKNYLSAPKLFFDMNRKLYHRKILSKLIPEMQKEGNEMPYTTDDVIMMLAATKLKRTRALIHFFASTGARPNVLEDPILRMEHLYDMPGGSKAILFYAGSREEYWAFLTPEAAASFEEYFDERRESGENLKPKSPVFKNRAPKKSKTEHMSTSTCREVMLTLVRKSRIERSKSGERFDKAVIYGFRKRFNTILKTNNSVNYNIAEKLMGHKNGLDGVYLKPTREQCFAEFAKAISELTVHPSKIPEIIQNTQVVSAN
ncbi:MAG: tyrosine-type recombinase/integrase [Nitrosotalea sp.]